jgi:hypothetical protein
MSKSVAWTNQFGQPLAFTSYTAHPTTETFRKTISVNKTNKSNRNGGKSRIYGQGNSTMSGLTAQLGAVGLGKRKTRKSRKTRSRK